MWFIFSDILWLIICDIVICLVLNDYLWCNYSLVLNFILKYLFVCFFIVFFILIKSNKQVDITDSFNKCVMLGLKNFDPFNKYVKLVLTYIVEYSWVDTTQTWHANTNYHPIKKTIWRDKHSVLHLDDSVSKGEFFSHYQRKSILGGLSTNNLLTKLNY